jgi:TolB-like protein
MSLFDELKRRNVIRVGIAYMALGWVLAQAADFAFDLLGAPDWALKTFVVALLLGLPVVLFFAWAFELTPEGIKREKDIDRSASITQHTGHKLNQAIVVLLVVAVGIVVLDRLVPETEQAAEPAADVQDQSIAVLPFVDLSSAQADAYLGQGLAEELLNALAQFPALRVAARTSAFAVADEGMDLREAGEVLGVAHVLEGSIRRSGDRLRITAQLIRASDGFHLWSETYERPMTDIFAIQDEIVRELSLALQVRLGVGAGAHRVTARQFEPRAYDSYLRGLQFWSNRHSDQNRIDAVRSFRLATEIDPAMADAWAAYALSLLHSGRDIETSGLRYDEWLPEIRSALLTALELDPDLARTHAGLALFYGRESIDIEKSRHHGDRALELAPNSAAVRYSRSTAALVMGDHESARREMLHARQLDPLNIVIARVEATQNMITGRVAEARDFLEECTRIRCEGVWSEYLAVIYSLLTGDREAAEAQVAGIERYLLDPSSSQYRDIRLALLEGGVIEPFACEDSFVEAMRDHDKQLRLIPDFAVIALDCLMRRGEYDIAADAMFTASSYGGFFQITEVLFLFSPGSLELPDEFRKHPRFHEFWTQPGYRELAAVRIANGRPHGLPLNEDGTLVDFSTTP